MVTPVIVLIIALCGAAFVAYHLATSLRTARRDLERYKAISDVEAAVRAAEKELAGKQHEHGDVARAIAALRAEANELKKGVALLSEEAEFLAYGVYTPKYDFKTAGDYQARLEAVKAQQKQAVKDGDAAVCPTEWQIEGSREKGRKATEQMLKLMLRAFNGECDALVGRVSYKNVESFAERTRKAFESLNKLGEGKHCSITPRYLELRLQELYLVHEYEVKLAAEKEEQRLIRERMREDEKAQKELERAQREAEQEAQQYERALKKAQEQLDKQSGAARLALEQQIAELRQSLAEAEERGKRALSQAQQTRKGHVYIISNVGSFGDKVYKVGMTRRLDPMERVAELGDASVPFSFDVHALIYSEDAPALESALHQRLAEQRVNLVNPRKEFFRAELAEIARIARELHGEFTLTLAAEAAEYRQSAARRQGPEPVPSNDVESGLRAAS